MLGALTPDEAAKQVFPNAPRSPNAGHNMETFNQIVASVRGGRMTAGSGDYVPGTPSCAAASGGGQSGNVKLAQTASGLALTGINIAALTSATVMAAVGGAVVLGAATMGIGALIGLFPMLFGHHAAAVRKEQSVLCSAVPAANNYLEIIDQAVRSGQATPQHGIEALNSLLNGFNSAVASIRHGSDPTVSGECNAACVMATELHAIVLEKSSEYQDLIAGAAQTVTPSRPNVVAHEGVSAPASSYASFYSQPAAAATSSSSDWLPIAAVLAAGFFLMRSL